MVLHGRLGLETARIPQADRHGLMWVSRGTLKVEDGTLRFVTAGADNLPAGDYAIPFQNISVILLGPGSMVSHDALRLCARHGTALVAVGEDGVRAYTAPPLAPDSADLARRQARVWADEETRLGIARRMYAWRLGEVLPRKDIDVLRGIEGSRLKTLYAEIAKKHGVRWQGRRYDRSNPASDDMPNQAINHAASAVEAAAAIAVTATGTLPQLGFIHEHSGLSFVLDIADLVRDRVTLPVAFRAVRLAQEDPNIALERHVRRLAGRTFYRDQVIPSMIDRIKELFDADDGRRDA